MITITEQLRDIANKLEEIEMESRMDKVEKKPRDPEKIEGMRVKSKYGNIIPSHVSDANAIDFLVMIDAWKEKIETLDDVQDERLKNDLKYWLEVLSNKIQQL